jgi:ribosomal protein L44E
VRLGDVIDDYCPRCRLLLNHDVASQNGNVVAKVTCRTCHNTHDYRNAEVPPKRPTKKALEKQKLFDEVLAGMGGAAAAPGPGPAEAPAPEAAPPPPVRKKRDLWAELERIRKK